MVLLPLLERRRESAVPLTRGARSLGRVLGTVVLGTLLAFLSCGSPQQSPQGDLTRQKYIDTYVELLRAVAAAPDSAAAADSTKAVLGRRGVSETELIDFARRRAANPQYLASVWLEIETRLRAPPDTAATRER